MPPTSQTWHPNVRKHSGKMKKIVASALLLLTCACSFGQMNLPKAEPPHVPPKTEPPIIVFSQEWPDATPSFFSVAITSTGTVTYRSTPPKGSEGVPYNLEFTASDATRTRIFELAKRLNFFRGNFDYTKARIAFTGTKTLRYHNGEEEVVTQYNWSDNPDIQQITKIFQDISDTIELGRMIQEKYRYDKLGVDEEVRKLEQASKDDRVAELQAIQPILSKIASDPSMMNITRRRAEFLLSKIPKTTALSGSR